MLKEQTIQPDNMTHIGGKYRYVNHGAGVVTQGYDTALELVRNRDHIRFDVAGTSLMKCNYDELYAKNGNADQPRLGGCGGVKGTSHGFFEELRVVYVKGNPQLIDWPKFIRKDTPPTPVNPDHEQVRLNLKYWGETVPAVAAYNKENNCDVKPWDCVLFEGDRGCFDTHPRFDCTDPDTYEFYVAIVYDERVGLHKPVFVGDPIWIKNNPYPVNWGLFEHWKGQVQTLSKDWTWSPPAPKREFEINGEKFTCPEQGKGHQHLLYFGSEYFYFKTAKDCDEVRQAISKLLRKARNQS